MSKYKYNHLKIEKNWQIYWEKNQTFKVDLDSKKPKYYILDMFPYPSGQGLHVGHPEGYTATDIIARFKRMQGFEVLHPIGFDSFGLPAEQYAIKTNNSPKAFTLQNIDNFIIQLKQLGFSFNWEKTLITSEPYYYKHTQWIFAQLHKNNLTELKMIEVNWCPELNTVLSNEEVFIDESLNMTSERGNFPVFKKQMKQWVLKITKYADQLFANLDNLDWPSNIKKLQKNWIYNEGNPEKGLHLRDWIFARQRYWGEPFPIVHLENGEIYLIPESKYPVQLPEISDYSFSKDGKPALSKVTNWLNYSDNDIKGKMDTNTMPQWAASSWYYIAYILKEVDLNNNNYILDMDSEQAKQRLKKWLPVDLYIGGQEHAVLHLLYARFWHLFLHDIGVVDSLEPFKKLFNQGMILGEDGQKMSKSLGNTISPDNIIAEYGADALRIYEMFMGPLSDDKTWSMSGIQGIRNWIERVYNLKAFEIIDNSNANSEDVIALNTLIYNFTNNLERLSFNNAASDMMVFLNYFYKTSKIFLNALKFFIQALSLFAPHLANELWLNFDFNEDLLYYSWPDYASIKLPSQRKIVLQYRGKFKQEIESNQFLKELSSGRYKIFDFKNDSLNEINMLLNSINLKKEDVFEFIYVNDKIINFI